MPIDAAIAALDRVFRGPRVPEPDEMSAAPADWQSDLKVAGAVALAVGALWLAESYLGRIEKRS